MPTNEQNHPPVASDSPSPEERIIQAAIDCIERMGGERVTTRAIAKQAGVNSAAINYYFRSKELLLERVMATTLDHLFEDLEAIVADETLTAGERLSELLDYLIDGATRYPGVTRAHMRQAMAGGNTPFSDRMNAVLARLTGAFQAGGTPRRGAEPGPDFQLIAAVSAALMPAVMPSFYHAFSGADFRDPRTRKAYVRTVVSRLNPEDGRNG